MCTYPRCLSVRTIKKTRPTKSESDFYVYFLPLTFKIKHTSKLTTKQPEKK